MAEPTDIPMLSAQIVAERTHLVIPTMPNWIEPTVEFLRQKAILGGACQETRSGKLLVSLHEAITNAVIHGNLELDSNLKEQSNSAFAEALAQRASDPVLSARTVDIVVDYDGEFCRWIITDQGKGFDVERVLSRCLSDDPEVLLASGRGILMMKSFLDDVRFDLGGRRVILSLARPSGMEKRKDNRVPVTAPFRVTPLLPDGKPRWAETYEVLSRNFSETGIAILQDRLVHSQQILIGIPTDQGIINIPAEVMHSRPFGSVGVELGCHFLQTLESAMDDRPAPPTGAMPGLVKVRHAVTHFLESYQNQKLPDNDRREHPRVVFNERVSIFLRDRTEPIIGYARDLSKGGIALIAQEPVPNEITVAFATAGDANTLKVHCRVVRCSCIKEGFYDIGASFLSLAEKIES